MKKTFEQKRQQAIPWYNKGESPESICLSLGCSKSWLYKWVDRYDSGNAEWNQEYSRLPENSPWRTSQEIEEVVKFIRLNLYNQGLFCGAQAILWELEEQGICPVPSLRTTNLILSRNDLTHKRTGRYEPKEHSIHDYRLRHPTKGIKLILWGLVTSGALTVLSDSTV